MMETQKLELSKNQQKFVRACKRAGFMVYYTYSGRGMYGRTCPAANIPQYESFNTRAKYTWDGMGMGTVVYAPY